MRDRTESGLKALSNRAQALSKVVIGRLVEIEDGGVPLVDYPGNPDDRPLLAMTTSRCNEDDVGLSVALLFADGDPAKPLIIGLIQNPLQESVEAGFLDGPDSETAAIEAQFSGRRVVLTAETELVLKCGKASITLTRAGNILLRGAYLLSRSSGVNRIKGGSVQIN